MIDAVGNATVAFRLAEAAGSSDSPVVAVEFRVANCARTVLLNVPVIPLRVNLPLKMSSVRESFAENRRKSVYTDRSVLHTRSAKGHVALTIMPIGSDCVVKFYG